MNLLTNLESGQGCAKRLWVMLTLSDDDAAGLENEMPYTLRAHLRHCAECRDVALQLSRTRASLQALDDSEELGSDFNVLLTAAKSRVHEAIADGIRLSGRVAIADEPQDLQPTQRVSRWSGQRLAIAASIFFVIGLIGYAFLTGSRDLSTPSITAKRAVPSIAQHEPKPTQESNRDSDQAMYRDGVAPHGENSQVVIGDFSGKEAGTSSPYYHRFTSYEDVLKYENPHGAQHAVILPDRSKRNIGLLKLFDKPATLLSTKEDRTKE